MARFHHGEEQYLFDRHLGIFGMFFWLAIKMIIYTPFLVGGYFLASLLLEKKDSGILWLILIILFVLVCLAIIHFLKRCILSLRSRRSLLWIFLLLFYWLITTVLPFCIIFKLLHHFILRLIHSANKADFIITLLSLCLAFIHYNRYYSLRKQ